MIKRAVFDLCDTRMHIEFGHFFASRIVGRGYLGSDLGKNKGLDSRAAESYIADHSDSFGEDDGAERVAICKGSASDLGNACGDLDLRDLRAAAECVGPIERRVSESLISVIPKQPWKAYDPITSTPERSSDLISAHPLKAEPPMVLPSPSNVIFSSTRHTQKDLSPIVLRDAGIVRVVISRSAKASIPTDSTEDPRSSTSTASQKWNARSPTLLSVSGRMIDLSFSHSSKAYSPISVSPSEKVTSESNSQLLNA